MMIHESIQQNIIQIKRQSSRAIRVTLDQEKAKMPIQVISTYAPHSGHKEETRQQHWKDVNELLNKTSKRHLIIWGADANGQIGNNEQNKEREQANKAKRTKHIIGPYTKRKCIGKGNGTDLYRTCKQQQMIPMTTWKKPRLYKKDKWKQKAENMTKEEWGEEN